MMDLDWYVSIFWMVAGSSLMLSGLLFLSFLLGFLCCLACVRAVMKHGV